MGLKYNDLQLVVNMKSYITTSTSSVDVSPGNIVLVTYVSSTGYMSSNSCAFIFIVDSSIDAFFISRVYTNGNVDTNTYIGPASSITFPYGAVTYSDYKVTTPAISSGGYCYILLYSN